jgi:hypothetical protein
VDFRVLTASGHIREDRLYPLTPAQTSALGDEVASLFAREPLYELGMEVLPSGWVHRVVAGGAAASAGVVAGDRVTAVDGKAEGDLELECERLRVSATPVELTLARGALTEIVRVTPTELPEQLALARLSYFYGLAAEDEKAEELFEQAYRAAEPDVRFFCAFERVLRLVDPGEYTHEMEKTIEDLEEPGPLVALFARYHLDCHDPGAAIHLLREHFDPEHPDHEMQLLLGIAYEQVQLHEEARPYLEAAARRGDPEAFYSMVEVMDRAGDEAAKARYLKYHFYGTDPQARVFGEDGKQLPPLIPYEEDNYWFELCAELARKHGLP